MVEFKLTVNKKQHTVYINKKIIETLGYELIIQLNAVSGVIYPKGVHKSEVIRSLEIILADLRHQVKLEEKKVTENNEF